MRRPVSYRLEVTEGTVALVAGMSSGWEADCARPGGRVSRRISCWSSRSRARFARALAGSGLWRHDLPPNYAWCMVTATYPGDWRSCLVDDTGAVSGLVLKRQWKTLLQLLRDTYWRDGDLVGCWKLEFQPRFSRPQPERQAPHFHLLVPLPVDRDVRGELRRHWSRIVGAQGVDRERHELVGLNVDWTEGARASGSPKRMAVYFLKHAAPGSDGSKEAQHEVPEDLNPGRFWAILGPRPRPLEIAISAEVHAQLRRSLREHATRRTGWDRQGQRTVLRPVATRQVTVRRCGHRHDGDVGPGELGPNLPHCCRYRKVTRPKRLLSAGHRVSDVAGHTATARLVPGGWVMADGAYGLAACLLGFFDPDNTAVKVLEQLHQVFEGTLPPVMVMDGVGEHGPPQSVVHLLQLGGGPRH